jgi:hypothetical protein
MRIIKISSRRFKSLNDVIDFALMHGSEYPNYLKPFFEYLKSSLEPNKKNISLSKEIHNLFLFKKNEPLLEEEVRKFLIKITRHIEDFKIPVKSASDDHSILLESRGYSRPSLEAEFELLKKVIFDNPIVNNSRSGIVERSLSRDNIDELKSIFDYIKDKNKNNVINLINEFKSLSGTEPKYKNFKETIESLENSGKLNRGTLIRASSSFQDMSVLFMGISLNSLSHISKLVISKQKDIKKFVKELVYKRKVGNSPLGLEEYRTESSEGFTMERSNPDEIYNSLLNRTLANLDNVAKPLGVALFLSFFGNTLDKAARSLT